MPKKKRRREKEKRSKKKCVNEMEVVSYEQQITDNNRQLARLQSRNKELEQELEECKKNLDELTEDRADVVAYLKRELDSRLEEGRELHDRLTALEETRKDELAAFKKKEESMEAEYKAMENKLTAEVKLAAGKLNALEDWRLARLELMEKFEDQERRMEEQEERNKKAVYEAEKRLVISKAKMQKEMEARLQDLCLRFSDGLNLQIAEATQRAIRESIWLHHECESLEESVRETESALQEQKESCRLLQASASLFEEEARLVLDKSNRQKSTITRLVHEISTLNFAITDSEREKMKLAYRANAMEKAEDQCREMAQELRLLENATEEVKQERERAQCELSQKERECKRLAGILKRAQECVKSVLQIEESPETEDAAVSFALKQELIASLQEILGTRVWTTENNA